MTPMTGGGDSGRDGGSVASAAVVARTSSPSWEDARTGAEPAASVVVATHNRATFLPELLAALGKQTADDVETVIVDDASGDDTWVVLEGLVATATRPVLALRLAEGCGPSVARNVGVL